MDLHDYLDIGRDFAAWIVDRLSIDYRLTKRAAKQLAADVRSLGDRAVPAIDLETPAGLLGDPTLAGLFIRDARTKERVQTDS